MWPIQLAFLIFIACSVVIFPWTPRNVYKTQIITPAIEPGRRSENFIKLGLIT
jgi:hypothetical protein